MYIKEDSASAVTGTATSSSTSLTLTTSNTSANVTITPNSANGTFAMSSTNNEAKFSVTTNNYTGYELRIKADDDNGNLVNVDNGITHTISSIPSSITKSSFDTTTYNNKWGFKPSRYVSNNVTVDNTGDSALFLPSPTTSGTVLDHTNVANTVANNYTIALGIRVDNNTYSGSYTKTFTLVATANPTTYIINYNQNTADTVTNMPTTQSSTTSETSITLASNTPERENYNFLGWCTVQTADNTCSGTTYQPGDTYGLDQTTENITTLYAIWQPSTLVMQNVTLDTCPTEPTEAVDSRDGEVYTIQKLADGNCWLLDNLRLDLTNAAVLDSLSTSNTNASSDSLTGLRLGNRNAGYQYATSGIQNWGSNYSYSVPWIATSGTGNNGNWDKDTLQSYGSGDSKMGIYYNYCAASAGSYCYGIRTDYGVPSGNATEDICPKGWHIPTGGSGGEYQALYAAYNSNATNFKDAFRAPLSGYFNNGSAYDQGSRVNFWSSTYSSNGGMHSLAVNLSSVDSQGSFGRQAGNPVRCIYDAINYTVLYDKNTTDAVSNMPFAQSGITSVVRPVVLSSDAPSRSGYTFLGWCDARPITSNDIDSCFGTKTNPGGIYIVNFHFPDVTLYAMWASNSSIMQSITSDNCPMIRAQAMDSRDGNMYYIQKLTYGSTTKCWMTTNLNLAGGTTLTSLDSNVSEGCSLDGCKLPASSTSGFTADKGAYVYNSGSTTCGNNSPCYSYYSWYAATAGQGAKSRSDICPKGWRLPTRSEYDALIATYDTNSALTASPFYGVYAGNLYNGSFYSGGSLGAFWTSDSYSETYGYYMYFNSYGPGINNSQTRRGYSVRCVTK